jgi:hypothetical protein
MAMVGFPNFLGGFKNCTSPRGTMMLTDLQRINKTTFAKSEK